MFDELPSQSEVIRTVIPFVVLSYLVITGFVMIVLGSIQEAARMREEMKTRWSVKTWSGFRLFGASALLALPSLLILIPIGVLIAL